MKKTIIALVIIAAIIAVGIYMYKQKAIDDAKKRVYKSGALLTEAKMKAAATGKPIDEVVTSMAKKLIK